MSDFHYVRTTGVDGGVDAVDGPAIGIDLASVLKDGLPPPKVALEIIAALCEILDIADQDGEVHGDVSPATVFIDETGAISLEGFGVERDTLRAPEGRPEGTLSDLYGLGYVAYRLLSSNDALRDISFDDPDAHDDTVIDAVIEVNFEDFPEEAVGDIQWYVAKLMSYDWEERPPAVDAWRTFIAFSSEIEGEGVVAWGEAVINGDAAFRDQEVVARKAAPPPASADEEDLGGPVSMTGPLAAGAINFGGGTKPGQATAFWSRDDMKKALKAADEEDDDSPAFKPQGYAATGFFTMDQMKAMADGTGDAPRPKRGGQRRGQATPTGGPSASAPPPAPPPAPGGPVAAPPAGPGPVVSAPIAKAATDRSGTGPAAGPAPQAPESSGPSMVLIAGLLVVLMVLCGGVALIGGGAFLMASDSSSMSAAEPRPAEAKPTQDTAAPPPEAEEVVAEPSEEQAEAAEQTPKVEAPKEEPKKPEAKQAAPEAPPTRRRPRRPQPPAKTPPAAAAGPAKVTFRIGATSSISCGDGQKKELDNTTTMTFAEANLPVSCMVQTKGGGMWAGLISKSGTVKCQGDGGSFLCSGP